MNYINILGIRNEQMEKISLSALKAVIKTAIETTSEKEELKKDLTYIVETIESEDSIQLVECNKQICRKYPTLFDVAKDYDLVKLSDGELDGKSLGYKIQSLHKIGHYIEDRIKGEMTTQLVKEVAKEVIEYDIKQISKK